MKAESRSCHSAPHEMLAVAALARATASHAYAYGARRLGAPAARAARAVSSRACAVSREADGAPGGNNEDAGEALAARLRAVAAADPRQGRGGDPRR